MFFPSFLMVITKRHLRFIIRTTRAGPASTLGMDRHQHSETYFPWITAFNSQNNLWGQGVPLLQSGNWGKMRVSYFHVRSPWWSLDSYPNYKLRSLSCHVFIFFLMTHSLFHLTNDLHTPPWLSVLIFCYSYLCSLLARPTRFLATL